MFKVTNSKSYVMTIIIDHKSKDVMVMVQFISCRAWRHVYYGLILLPLPVAAVNSVCRSPWVTSACPGLTRSATELCGR